MRYCFDGEALDSVQKEGKQMSSQEKGYFAIKKVNLLRNRRFFRYGKDEESSTKQEALMRARQFIGSRKDAKELTLWWFARVGDEMQFVEKGNKVDGLMNAHNCSDELFERIYSDLELRVSSEASALYNQAVSAAKTKSQKIACAGSYKGKWFKLFDNWCSGKVENIFVLDAMSSNYIHDGLLD